MYIRPDIRPRALQLKTSAFRVLTRSVVLHAYTCDFGVVFETASKLLSAQMPVSLRLLGVRLTHLTPASGGALDAFVAPVHAPAAPSVQTAQICPVCGTFRATSNGEMNDHLDRCLGDACASAHAQPARAAKQECSPRKTARTAPAPAPAGSLLNFFEPKRRPREDEEDDRDAARDRKKRPCRVVLVSDGEL